MPELSAAAPTDLGETNLFAYCSNNPVNRSDPSGLLSNWVKVGIGVAIIAAAAAVTVATGGAAAGTLVAAVHCVAAGALEGAVIGAATGAVTGAATGVISNRISTGSWSGSTQAAWNGAADGFMAGSITGSITGGIGRAVQLKNAASAWNKGTFDSSYDSMLYHYNKHVQTEGLSKGTNVIKYMRDALSFSRKNSSLFKFTYNYKYGNASWNFSYTSGRGGMFTSAGKILTFWYK